MFLLYKMSVWTRSRLLNRQKEWVSDAWGWLRLIILNPHQHQWDWLTRVRIWGATASQRPRSRWTAALIPPKLTQQQQQQQQDDEAPLTNGDGSNKVEREENINCWWVCRLQAINQSYERGELKKEQIEKRSARFDGGVKSLASSWPWAWGSVERMPTHCSQDYLFGRPLCLWLLLETGAQWTLPFITWYI